MKPVFIATALLMIPMSAVSQESLDSFLTNERSGGVWDIDCYQGGNKIISERNLRLLQHTKKRTIGNTLINDEGYPLNIAPSTDLACVVRQISGAKQHESLVSPSEIEDRRVNRFLDEGVRPLRKKQNE